MGADLGNELWKLNPNPGRKKAYRSGKALLDKCIEYFDWNEANPLYETKPFHYQGDVVLKDIPKKRPMTLSGLCAFLQIDQRTWCDYRKQDVFFRVTKYVDDIIRRQKFEGAASGFFNPNIIARDLGLVDKVYNVNEELPETGDAEAELKKRGIPIPDIELEDM